MGKDETDRVKEYIQEDRPRRLRSYVRKHKVNLARLELKKNRNVLHFCCRHGSGPLYRYLQQEGVDVYHCDIEGNTPLHLALQRALRYERAGKYQLATECYTDIILPYIEKFPNLLDARNCAEESCRELLRQIAEHRESTQPAKNLESPESSPNCHDNMSERLWRDKIAEECQYEYETTWGQYEHVSSDAYSSTETYDDWADRIKQEYYAKKRAQSEHANRGAKRQKTAHNPYKTQAGPENLEDIRAKMKEEFERKNKEDSIMKMLKERLKYEKRYKELLENKDKNMLDLDDIPWPSRKGDKYDMTVLFEGMDKEGEEYRKYLRDQQVRWHPDKFMQRFGEHLNERDKEKILNRVTRLSQDLNKMLK